MPLSRCLACREPRGQEVHVPLSPMGTSPACVTRRYGLIRIAINDAPSSLALITNGLARESL